MATRRGLLKMAVSAGIFSKGFGLAANSTGAETGLIEWILQTRDQRGIPHTTTEQVDPRKVGIVVMDVWNYNVCKTSRTREASLIPRLNQSFAAARKLGMTLVFSPTNSMRDLHESPQRKATLALPNHLLPASVNLP